MSIKKISAAVMAAAVLAVGAPVMGMADPLVVVASAAEEKLVTETLDAAINEKFFSENRLNLGGGYYALKNETRGIDKIIRIGDKEVEKWRSTGKLEPTTIQCDIDMSNGELSGNLSDGDYVLFLKRGEAYDYETGYVLKLDKASGKMTKAYEFPANECKAAFCKKGYCVEVGNAFPTSCVRSIYTPTGEKVNLSSVENLRVDVYAAVAGKYLCYVNDNAMGSVGGVTPEGSYEKIEESGFFICESGYGFIHIVNAGNHNSSKVITDDSKIYEFTIKEVEGVYSDNYVVAVNGNIAILKEQRYDEKWEAYYLFRLIDLNDAGKPLSKDYKSMSTADDGKTYLVSTSEGKWGYIDGTGKELAMFDDASNFVGNGLYAPVVKDGKGWLIDRNFNQVSEKIDATGCTTYGDELFRFKTANGDILATSTSKGMGASSDGKTAITDKSTGVTVNGKFPVGTKLNAKVSKKDDNTYVADISPVDASGNTVQPDGAAVVGVMLPAELKGKTLNVYRVVDGKYTKMNSWADGDMLFFTTSHFSEFEITTEQREEANPDTGANGMFGLAAVSIAAVGVMLVSRKKK